jgi:hypothetical protein
MTNTALAGTGAEPDDDTAAVGSSSGRSKRSVPGQQTGSTPRKRVRRQDALELEFEEEREDMPAVR